jgi:hypothetical protein
VRRAAACSGGLTSHGRSDGERHIQKRGSCLAGPGTRGWGGQGVHREVESEGPAEKLRAVIDGGYPADEPVGQRGGKVESALWRRRRHPSTPRTKVCADGTERKSTTCPREISAEAWRTGNVERRHAYKPRRRSGDRAPVRGRRTAQYRKRGQDNPRDPGRGGGVLRGRPSAQVLGARQEASE